jgi:hypothetical protein
MKIGDLVKASPAPKWDMDPEDNTHIGIVTKLAHSIDGYTDQIILLSFANVAWNLRTNDWRFEILSQVKTFI